MIQEETANDSVIINNLMHNEDGQEVPDSTIANEIYAGIRLSNKLEKHFLKIDPDSKRSLKLQKDLRSSISDYREVYRQLTNQPLSQKLITDFMVPINKSVEIVSSDESKFEPINRKKMRILDYSE
ncbi:uncharacterized protein TNCV_3291801 [Trichonephila clavipes]|nr:uncharacterized protein TNCV_3291801 [Trichonephila clavipes]